MKAGRPDQSPSGSSVHYYWVGVFLVLTGVGVLAVLACWFRKCRHGGRYEYTALEAESGVHERLELEKKARERAHTACVQYLRACPRYAMLHHLNDIGSRVDKHWFVVRDTSVKTERLLTLVPRSADSACAVTRGSVTRSTLLELFAALQHPYIYPVLDIDLREGGHSYVVVVLPFNSKGSLKDLIYKSHWQDEWSHKYGERSTGLPPWQVQRLGRQILEALMFLRERGFPPFAHLHSGNVIVQNGVARLAGLENTLLGHTARIHPVVWRRAHTHPQAVDTICFGHVLFEMCAGYELCAPEPSAGHLLDIQGYPQVVDILQAIFQAGERRCPGVDDLLLCDFFRNIDLREMRATPLPVFRSRMTSSTISLLSDLRKHQNGRRARRSHSASTPEAHSPPPRERRNSVGGASWSQQEGEDSSSDRQPSPAQEHRDLSLHVNEDSSLSMETRCLLR